MATDDKPPVDAFEQAMRDVASDAGGLSAAQAARQIREFKAEDGAGNTPADGLLSHTENDRKAAEFARKTGTNVQHNTETPAHMTVRVNVDRATGQAVGFRGALTVDGPQNGDESVLPEKLVIPPGASQPQILALTEKYLRDTGMFDQPGMAKDFLNPNGKTLAAAEAFVHKAAQQDGDVDPYAANVFESLKAANAQYNDPATPKGGGPVVLPTQNLAFSGPGLN